MRQGEHYLDRSAAHNSRGQEEVDAVRADIPGFRQSLTDRFVRSPANDHGEPKLEPLSGASLVGSQGISLSKEFGSCVAVEINLG
jgi:hypothetical protein